MIKRSKIISHTIIVLKNANLIRFMLELKYTQLHGRTAGKNTENVQGQPKAHFTVTKLILPRSIKNPSLVLAYRACMAV